MWKHGHKIENWAVYRVGRLADAGSYICAVMYITIEYSKYIVGHNGS